MDKLTQLFIRACKTNDAEKRIRSIYTRAYYHVYEPKHIANILTKICDAYTPFDTYTLLGEFSPALDWKYANVNDYWTRCVRVLISHIRFTEVAKFAGLTTPARFRQEEEKNAVDK